RFLDRSLAVLAGRTDRLRLRPGRHRPGAYRGRMGVAGTAADLCRKHDPSDRIPIVGAGHARDCPKESCPSGAPARIHRTRMESNLQTRQTIIRLLSSMASAKEISQYVK